MSQSQISLLERRRLVDIRLSEVGRLLATMGIRYRLVLEPTIHEPRRLSDLIHARCSAHVGRRLAAAGWQVEREVEIGSDRSRGWIDLLAYDPITGVLLVIEIKTEIHDVGQIERSMNWYQREAWAAARRLGWQPRSAGSALLVLQSETNDRLIGANREVLAAAFPNRADALIDVVTRESAPAEGRHLAMIDPRSHRARWLRRSRLDGRRSKAPYIDYIDAVRRLEQGSSRV